MYLHMHILLGNHVFRLYSKSHQFHNAPQCTHEHMSSDNH